MKKVFVGLLLFSFVSVLVAWQFHSTSAAKNIDEMSATDVAMDGMSRKAERTISAAASTMGDLVARDDILSDQEVKSVFDSAELITQGLVNVEIKGLVLESISKREGVFVSHWKEIRGEQTQVSLEEALADLPDKVIPRNGSVIRAEIIAHFRANGFERDISKSYFLRPRTVMFVEREYSE